MTVTRPPAATAAYVRAGALVKLAWGVDLHTSHSGGLHESVVGLDLIEPFEDQSALAEVVSIEQHGPDFDGDLLIIRRTLTWAGDGLEVVTADKIAPPTGEEAAAVNTALDHLGYTGPREIRLLLAVDYS